MKRDQKLVSEFLSAYGRDSTTSFKVVRWPDDENRQTPAIEAVASDQQGHTIAIEHTLIQPFEGERTDTERFMRVFGRLEGCRDLMKAGYNIDVSVKVGTIPTGVKWETVAERVHEHLANIIPMLGEVDRLEPIPDLPFALPVRLSITTHGSGESDHVWVSRFDMPDSLQAVVRSALRRKLPKLIAESAKRRILLLEQADMAHGHAAVRIAIDNLNSEVPELARVDEIWLVVTTCWETEGVLFFYELFPDIMGKKLRINSSRTALAAKLVP